LFPTLCRQPDLVGKEEGFSEIPLPPFRYLELYIGSTFFEKSALLLSARLLLLTSPGSENNTTFPKIPVLPRTYKSI
jgi:hypothetical protein